MKLKTRRMTDWDDDTVIEISIVGLILIAVFAPLAARAISETWGAIVAVLCWGIPIALVFLYGAFLFAMAVHDTVLIFYEDHNRQRKYFSDEEDKV
jgi:hypothetical protein